MNNRSTLESLEERGNFKVQGVSRNVLININKR